MTKAPMGVTKAHCNQCGGDRNHGVLAIEKTSWTDEAYDHIHGGDSYEMLKCLGCEQIKLRHTSWVVGNDDSKVSYFPPPIFRPNPKWFSDLWYELPDDADFVGTLLKEIYVALQNNLSSLATMGIRSLLEKVMIAKIGDQGSFRKNLIEFEKQGYVSRIQKERLEAILEAGHAVIHRTFMPSTKDVITLVDITEHIIETVYLHEDKVKELQKRVPPRTNQK